MNQSNQYTSYEMGQLKFMNRWKPIYLNQDKQLSPVIIQIRCITKDYAQSHIL